MATAVIALGLTIAGTAACGSSSSGTAAGAPAAITSSAAMPTPTSIPTPPSSSATDVPSSASSRPSSGGTSPTAATSASSTKPTAPSTSPSTAPATTSSAAASTGSSTAPSTASLAGRIRPGVSYKGVATAYDAGTGDGACLFGPAATMMIAAMNVADYETSKACGDTIAIHADNGKSITVLITNECPAPCAPGQIDLSHEAFSKLADLRVGRLSITWSLVSPAAGNPISIRYKTGSSQWWCAVQVIGHRNPVAQLELKVGGGWRQLPRTDYNYFLSADGTGCGGTIRVTDIYGQQLVITGISVSPGVVQHTGVQFAHH
ncbi:MAG: hypothetical protein HOV87_15635 [Catenulispora sp.]|nr:hypothetical protein [Catenulispora sp.]